MPFSYLDNHNCWIGEEQVRSCYKLMSQAKNWQGARDACKSTGGHLVAMETREEFDHVVSIIRENPGLTMRAGLSGSSVGFAELARVAIWTAGYKVSPGEWRWADVDQPLTYDAWGPDQPYGDGVCMNLSPYSLQLMNHLGCELFRPFICEFKLS